MRRIAIILAACALMSGSAAPAGAESGVGRDRSAWPDEQESKSKTPLSKWLPSVLGSSDEAETEAVDTAPAASQAAPQQRRQQRRQQPARRAAEPEPDPDPEPQLTRKEMEAEARWWKEIGDPVVAAFSRCLQEHVIDEITRGSKSSYPDFVTSAMNSRCSREFSAMAHVILDQHGQDNFARIARKLIATKFVPAVKHVAEGGSPEALPPEEDRLALEAEMRRSKEAMLDCLEDQADRLATSSAAAVDQVADLVIATCRAKADTFFGKLEQLWPGTIGGAAGQGSAAILDASYRPAILRRIAGARAAGPATADTIAAPAGGAAGPKEDSETLGRKQPESVSHKQPEPARQGPQKEAFSPPVAPVPGSAVPANSRP